jgi:hypothetical protein
MFNHNVYYDPSGNQPTYFLPPSGFPPSPPVYYHQYVPQYPFQPTSALTYPPHQYTHATEINGGSQPIYAKPLYPNLKNVYQYPGDETVYSTPPEVSTPPAGSSSLTTKERIVGIVEGSLEREEPKEVVHAMKIVADQLDLLVQFDDDYFAKKLTEWTSSFLKHSSVEENEYYFKKIINKFSEGRDFDLLVLNKFIQSDTFNFLPALFHTWPQRLIEGEHTKEQKNAIYPILIQYTESLIRVDRDSEAKIFLDNAVHLNYISRQSKGYYHFHLQLLNKVDELNQSTAYRTANYLHSLTVTEMSQFDEWEELFPLALKTIHCLFHLDKVKVFDDIGYAKLPQFLMNDLEVKQHYPWAKPLALKLIVGIANQQLNDKQEKELDALLSEHPTSLQELDKNIPEDKYLRCIRSQPLQEQCQLLFSLINKDLEEGNLEVAYPRMVEIFQLLKNETLPALYYSKLRLVIKSYVEQLVSLNKDEKNYEVILSKLFDLIHQPLTPLYEIYVREHFHLVDIFLDCLGTLPKDKRKASIISWCITVLTEHPESSSEKDVFDGVSPEHKSLCLLKALDLLLTLTPNQLYEALPSPLMLNNHLPDDCPEETMRLIKQQLFKCYVKVSEALTRKHQRDTANHFLRHAMAYRLEGTPQEVTHYDIILLNKYMLKRNSQQVIETANLIDKLLDKKNESVSKLTPIIKQFVTGLMHTKALSPDEWVAICHTLYKAHQIVPYLSPLITASVMINNMPTHDIVTETAAALLLQAVNSIKDFNRFRRNDKATIRKLCSFIIPRATLPALFTMKQCLENSFFGISFFQRVTHKFQSDIMSRIYQLAPRENISLANKEATLDIAFKELHPFKTNHKLTITILSIIHSIVTVHSRYDIAQKWLDNFFISSSKPIHVSKKITKKISLQNLPQNINVMLTNLLVDLMAEGNQDPTITNRLFSDNFYKLTSGKSSLKFISNTIKRLVRLDLYSDSKRQDTHNEMISKYLIEPNLEPLVTKNIWDLEYFYSFVDFVKASGMDSSRSYLYFAMLGKVDCPTKDLIDAFHYLMKEVFVYEEETYATKRLVLTLQLGAILSKKTPSQLELDPSSSEALSHILLLLLDSSNDFVITCLKSLCGNKQLDAKMLQCVKNTIGFLMNSPSPQAQISAYELFECIEDELFANDLKKTKKIFSFLLFLCDQHGLGFVSKNEPPSIGIELISEMHLKRLIEYPGSKIPAHLIARSMAIVNKQISMLTSGNFDTSKIWCSQFKFITSYLNTLSELHVFENNKQALAQFHINLLLEAVRMRCKFTPERHKALFLPILNRLSDIMKRNLHIGEFIQNEFIDILEDLSKNIQNKRDSSCLMILIQISKYSIIYEEHPRISKILYEIN